jgi:hypothetical protein
MPAQFSHLCRSKISKWRVSMIGPRRSVVAGGEGQSLLAMTSYRCFRCLLARGILELDGPSEQSLKTASTLLCGDVGAFSITLGENMVDKLICG